MAMKNNNVIDMQSAYHGEFGSLRKQFCIDFTGNKQISLRRIDDEIVKLIAAVGTKITCRKGCPACCVLYIQANVQECEAIAYHLYENQRLLDSFIQKYEKWRIRIRQLGGAFALCEQILHHDPKLLISKDDQAAMLEVLKRYQEQNIPCSFLEEGACSIHAVRPYVCANHYVTTPEIWCRAENWCNPSYPHRPKIYMTDIDELDERKYYPQDLDKPVIGFMPTMVYRILTEGFSYLSEITGRDIITT
jgi:hypothetical protein